MLIGRKSEETVYMGFYVKLALWDLYNYGVTQDSG